jgi:hypothetical protein
MELLLLPYRNKSPRPDMLAILREEEHMTTSTLLLLVLILMLLGALPAWPYSRSWGYFPSGGVGTLLLILIVLMFMGHI